MSLLLTTQICCRKHSAYKRERCNGSF